MAYSIRKNWARTFELLLIKPVIIFPFVIVAFLEGLALEFIYFATRKPLSVIANPIIRKYFGESSLHYPGHVLILPDIFYYAEIAIYTFAGIFLIAVAVNIFRNIRLNLPLKPDALIKNSLKQYPYFVIFGILMITLVFLSRKSNMFLFHRLTPLGIKYLPWIGSGVYFGILLSMLFLSNCILQTFLISTVPLMVIEKRPFLKALWGSLSLGFRNFLTIFTLIFFPFLIYLPVIALKNFSPYLASRLFPEINIYIVALGIIVGALIDCFLYMCVSQFLMDKAETKK